MMPFRVNGAERFPGLRQNIMLFREAIPLSGYMIKI